MHGLLCQRIRLRGRRVLSTSGATSFAQQVKAPCPPQSTRTPSCQSTVLNEALAEDYMRGRISAVLKGKGKAPERRTYLRCRLPRLANEYSSETERSWRATTIEVLTPASFPERQFFTPTQVLRQHREAALAFAQSRPIPGFRVAQHQPHTATTPGSHPRPTLRDHWRISIAAMVFCCRQPCFLESPSPTRLLGSFTRLDEIHSRAGWRRLPRACSCSRRAGCGVRRRNFTQYQPICRNGRGCISKRLVCVNFTMALGETRI
jgi:hypothetical protein